MFRRLRKGQSTAEYAIVIGLVLAAAVAMQVYVKRGIQGKFKDASDAAITYNVTNSTDGDFGVNCLTQYEPQYSAAPAMITNRTVTENVTVSKGGGVTRAIVGGEVSSRTGKQYIYNVTE